MNELQREPGRLICGARTSQLYPPASWFNAIFISRRHKKTHPMGTRDRRSHGWEKTSGWLTRRDLYDALESHLIWTCHEYGFAGSLSRISLDPAWYEMDINHWICVYCACDRLPHCSTVCVAIQWPCRQTMPVIFASQWLRCPTFRNLAEGHSFRFAIHVIACTICMMNCVLGKHAKSKGCNLAQLLTFPAVGFFIRRAYSNYTPYNSFYASSAIWIVCEGLPHSCIMHTLVARFVISGVCHQLLNMWVIVFDARVSPSKMCIAWISQLTKSNVVGCARISANANRLLRMSRKKCMHIMT